VLFPGTNCEQDVVEAVAHLGGAADIVWHGDRRLPSQVDAVVLPGGFAHGDHLRAGAIARFAPVMAGIEQFAHSGGLVLGICNGFQVLAEAGLVPGALLRNRGLRFVCRQIAIAPERLDTPFTQLVGERRPLRMPVAHGEGCYIADDATLDQLERDGQVLFRYVTDDGAAAPDGDRANPNGSLRAIAGVINADGNVAGLMPHPETAVEAILGSDDGLLLIRSFVESAGASRAATREPATVGAR
jgi:phosphoribosylformylglycinamidine synthase subunit PurQ / glutaminase